MTLSLKHAFHSAKADGTDTTVVQPSNWNDEHALTCATSRMLGRATAGAGAVEELDPATARTVMDTVCKSGDTMTGNLSIISSTSERSLTLGSSEGYFYGNATEAGWKKIGGGSYSINATSGDFTASGNVTAYSDERLKEDIETIENALDLVKRMRGVRFTRRSDKVRGIGVVAQEMQKVVPEVVINNESRHLSVAYGNLVGVLIEAVKELTARVEELEAR